MEIGSWCGRSAVVFATAVKASQNVDKLLLPGGWICFDDAFTSYRGVGEAIKDHIIKNPDYEMQQQMTRKLFIARKK